MILPSLHPGFMVVCSFPDSHQPEHHTRPFKHAPWFRRPGPCLALPKYWRKAGPMKRKSGWSRLEHRNQRRRRSLGTSNLAVFGQSPEGLRQGRLQGRITPGETIVQGGSCSHIRFEGGGVGRAHELKPLGGIVDFDS